MLVISIFLAIFQVGSGLKCYDSSYPVADREEECPRPNMLCYSEFYTVNRSGSIRPYHDRFCVDEKLCINRNIFGCKNLSQLSHKVQKAFIKYHVKAIEAEILDTRFCCCDSDLCNFGGQYTIPFLIIGLLLCFFM